MDIQTVRTLRSELEFLIGDKIKEFEKQTGVTINDVQLVRDNRLNGESVLICATVELKL